MIRAGVSQSVAMSISGHRTTSMFLRYNITSDDDRRQALRRTEAHLAAIPDEPKAAAFADTDKTRTISPPKRKNGLAPTS
jgi:hypothetical protein